MGTEATGEANMMEDTRTTTTEMETTTIKEGTDRTGEIKRLSMKTRSRRQLTWRKMAMKSSRADRRRVRRDLLPSLSREDPDKLKELPEEEEETEADTTIREGTQTEEEAVTREDTRREGERRMRTESQSEVCLLLAARRRRAD